MKIFFVIFILVNVGLELLASPDPWDWNDEEDPDFSSTERPESSTVTRNFRRCLKRCPSISKYSPVCGTDSTTYDNESKLNCAKRCGANIDKAYEGSCNNRRTTTSKAPITRSTPTPGPNPSPVTPEPRCFKKCPKTTEYNPLCGSDGRTYDNESKLECAKQCGVRNVRKAYDGVCASPAPVTSPRPTVVPTTLPPNFRSCVRQCIVSPTYQPVCATFDLTFDNESALQCDISCGRRIQKVRDGSC